MVALITDDFNRPDAATLGTDWDEVDESDASIVSNLAQIMQGSSGDVGSVRHVDTLDSVDHYAEAIYADRVGGGAATVGGVCVRFAPSAKTFYYAWTRVSGTWAAGRVVTGTRTQLSSYTPPSAQAFPHLSRLEVEGTALKQTVVGQSVDAVVNEFTDSNITGGTQVGMHGHPAANDQPRMDDFEAGVLGTPPAEDGLRGPNGGLLRGPNGGLLRLAGA